MKKIKMIVLLFTLSSIPALATLGSSTDVMGGGTPGRDDDNRMSKEMYDYQNETQGVKKARNLEAQERLEEQEAEGLGQGQKPKYSKEVKERD